LSFSRIVAKAVDDRLLSLPIDTPDAARRSLPELDELAGIAPSSSATLRAKAARGVVILADAEAKHVAGDYEGALAGYRQALSYFPRGDPGRTKVVDHIEAATNKTVLAGMAFRDCPDVCPEMVLIPAGSFTMGSALSEPNRQDEGPQHDVKIAARLSVSKYPITFEQYSRFVMETNYTFDDSCYTFEGGSFAKRGRRNFKTPGFSQAGNEPVVCVNWTDAQAYISWLAKKTGHVYRLLSEAEYEYVNRAGTTTVYWWGDSVGVNRASCDGCGSAWDKRKTSPVGSFSPNSFGLYDTTGDVWSWTADCWNANYNSAPIDGSAATSGDCGPRVLRGGSWLNDPRDLLSAQRNATSGGNRSDAVGFRVARTS
jgi:formylglycine-generating enzyme required for sulfatase activity